MTDAEMVLHLRHLGYRVDPPADLRKAEAWVQDRDTECNYRGALAECHSLDCPVHGKGKQ
jgi:hypothetical protein